MHKISLLDCTLRDGAYITDSMFGDPAIRGIIKKLQDAHVEMIECGWLKDKPHVHDSTFYHVPSDIVPYLIRKSEDLMYVAMIDWDRYDTDQLPVCDGKSIDAIRIVFPHGKHKQGVEVGRKIREKGYKVCFQAANTLAYSDEDLLDLASTMNEFEPVSLSIVDTFGAMYFDDLEHIAGLLDKELKKGIDIGFHAHNNQQLAFALCIRFIEMMKESNRNIMVDASLCGMGRGAGNATTELLTSYLNRKQNMNYDMNAIMDAIDIYMSGFQENYSWGYSTPYFIAGTYQCHVNNIAYLLKNHRTNAKDMRTIIESLSVNDRRKYDYDLLEQKYLENQNRIVDDELVIENLQDVVSGRPVLLIAPGKTANDQCLKIKSFIGERNPVVIMVNAINPNYRSDYQFYINSARYEYAKLTYPQKFNESRKILLSNIKTTGDEDESIINFNTVIKRGWEHFDNAVITCLRLMYKIGANDIYIAGFDGFKTKYNESYADASLPTLNPDNKWDELNDEISDMYHHFKKSVGDKMKITFVTESIFEEA